MKISVWWLLAVPVLIAGIAKSEGEHFVSWDLEMKRPEAQKAIQHYVERNCQILTFGAKGDTLTTTDVNSGKLHLNCWVDWTDEHQK